MLGHASVHTPPRAPAAYVPHPCEVSSSTSQQTGPLRPRPCTAGARPARARRRGHTIRLRPVPRLGPRRLPRRPGSADPAGERTRHPAFWGASSHGAGYDPPVLAGTRRSGRLGTQKKSLSGVVTHPVHHFCLSSTGSRPVRYMMLGNRAEFDADTYAILLSITSRFRLGQSGQDVPNIN